MVHVLRSRKVQRPSLDPHLLPKQQNEDYDKERASTNASLGSKANLCSGRIRPSDLEVGDDESSGLH